MNRYLFLRRAKGPAMVVTFGVTALLNNFGVLDYGRSWPLYLLVLGVMMLAERAALAGAARMSPAGENPPSAGHVSDPNRSDSDPSRHGPWITPPPSSASTALSVTPREDDAGSGKP